MKLYRNIIFFLIAILCMGVFVGCNEDETLDGASEVYITLNPMDITLRVGDTIKISAVVTNLSGNRIETPITWTVLDEDVAKVLGDTAIVCVTDAQGKETKLKAELVNGKYALTNVTVTTNLPEGITPIDESGAIISSKHSYNITHDSVLFAVSPKELLEDFEPQYTIEGLEPFRIPMTVYKDKGLVAVHYSAPRAAGEGKITVSIGDGSSAKTASCTVVSAPKLLATFYGEKFAEMPYLGTRPDRSVLPQWFAYTNESSMDINSEMTIRVAINTESGALEDIEAAYSSYHWEAISGSAVVISEKYEEFVENQGFDAVLTVRAGIEEGEAEFHCITSDTVLVATFSVQDYKNRYPVDKITVSHESIKMPVGDFIMFTTGVEPIASYAYHKPVVVAENPNIIEIGEYDGNLIILKGLEIGETKLILTSNGKQLEVPVTITEGIKSVLWEKGNQRVLFAGQSVQWGVDARTTSDGPNPYEVKWISSDTSILKAAQVDKDNTKGIITAVTSGTATIIAEVANVRSDDVSVKVIDLPADQTYTSSNTDYDNTIVIPAENERDLLVYVALISGQKLTITLTGAYSGGSYDGTYQVSSYPASVNIDEAEAPVTSGYVTLASDNDGNVLISFDLMVSVTSDKTFTLKADNVVGLQ